MHENEFFDIGLVSDMQKLQNAILVEVLEESLKLNCKMISIDRAFDCKLTINLHKSPLYNDYQRTERDTILIVCRGL